MEKWEVIKVNEGWEVENINVGIIYIFEIYQIEVYGVIMGGWEQNQKYKLIGEISYEEKMV